MRQLLWALSISGDERFSAIMSQGGLTVPFWVVCQEGIFYLFPLKKNKSNTITSLMKPVCNDLIRFLALCIFILARDLSSSTALVGEIACALQSHLILNFISLMRWGWASLCSGNCFIKWFNCAFNRTDSKEVILPNVFLTKALTNYMAFYSGHLRKRNKNLFFKSWLNACLHIGHGNKW